MSKRSLTAFLLVSLAMIVSCGGGSPAGKKASEEARKEVSDLDTPVGVLFSRICEHNIKTFECDECRYETGVVKVSPDLLGGELIKTGNPERRRVEVPLLLNGEVRFDERRISHLSTQAEGIITRVHATLGDKVKRGQPLLEIESVGVGEAEGAYREALADLALARKDHERAEALRTQGILSERDYQKSRQELEVAEIRAKTALGTLARLGMSEADASAAGRTEPGGRLVLKSPADGTVLSLHAVPGEVARAEEPLATVGDNSAVWVWADVYERDIALVAGGGGEKALEASVSVRAYPGEEFPGTVDFVSPLMDESSRTVRLRVKVDNSKGKLLSGMFAAVKLHFPGEDVVTTVPSNAVMEDEGRSFVFIHHHGDYYIRRPVVTGRSWGGFTEIAAGLEGSETVVSDGSFLLKSDVLRSKMGAGCAD